MISVLSVAAICHEANKEYCEQTGDFSQPAWEDAPDWQKQSAIKGVEYHLDNPDSTPADSHNSWLAEKTDDGWKYGEVKDPEKKEHPCYLPYDQLPRVQQAKDYIFHGIINSLRDFVVR